MNGAIEILIITVSLAVIMAIIYRVMQKPEEIRVLKQKQMELRAKINNARKLSDKKAVDSLMSEMLKLSHTQMKMNMKPLLLTTIIFLFAIAWMGSTYANVTISLPFTLPFFGSNLSWLWWYIVIIIPSMQIFRKVFGVE